MKLISAQHAKYIKMLSKKEVLDLKMQKVT